MIEMMPLFDLDGVGWNHGLTMITESIPYIVERRRKIHNFRRDWYRWECSCGGRIDGLFSHEHLARDSWKAHTRSTKSVTT